MSCPDRLHSETLAGESGGPACRGPQHRIGNTERVHQHRGVFSDLAAKGVHLGPHRARLGSLEIAALQEPAPVGLQPRQRP